MRTYSKVFGRKARVILDKRFPFAKNLQHGDKGQLIATLEVESIRTQMDEEDNDMVLTNVRIIKAEPLTNQDARAV